jgi:acetylornithine deacetylase/succinyl-diaminopimelate desuccinylase-like protein
MPGLRLARGAAEATAQLLVGTWSSSLAVVGADGFPPTSEAGSVIRPFSAVKIVLRIPPTAEARAVAAEIEERILAEPPEGASVELLDVVAENGFDAPEAAPWLAAALDEASAESFGEPAGRVGEGGSIPFLGALKARYPAAQFAVTGVLDPDSNAHGPDESLHIPTAKHLTASLARLLSRAP